MKEGTSENQSSTTETEKQGRGTKLYQKLKNIKKKKKEPTNRSLYLYKKLKIVLKMKNQYSEVDQLSTK